MTTEPTAPGPVCKFEQGCHRVVACEPGCGAPAAPLPADRAALRDRIADALAAKFTCGAEHTQGMRVAFEGPDDWPATRMVTPIEAADAVLAGLPQPADRAGIYAEVAARLAADAEEGTKEGLTRIYRRSAAKQVQEWGEELRRLAIEPHSCDNCQGIDPDTCWTNPNRPPEQCPRSEADGYGLQCQKPAGHNLCTFEEDSGAASQPAADGWCGATEIASDREVQRLAATGLVGYRQDRGRLLHCLHHKPAPASRYVDFQEVTADDLPDGGICVHPSCGADLLAVQSAAGGRQDGAQS